MKRRLLVAAVALFAMVSFASLNAKDPDPYKNVIESSGFTTFSPAGNFSLQAKLSIGESIEARNANGTGFVYKAAKPGVYSFLVDIASGTVKVYWGGTLQDETVAVTTSLIPVSVGGEDLVGSDLQSESMKTGIYKSTNLIKNPGFEKIAGYFDNYNPEVNPSLTDVRGKAQDWNVLEQFYVFNSCRDQDIQINSGYEALRSAAEGKFAFMLHNVSTPLWQELGGLKPSSWYKVSYRQLAHMDTSAPSAYASFITKDSVNAAEDASNVLATYSYMSAPEGLGNYVDVTYGFKTPEVLPADLYLSIKRTGVGGINHFDRMTLQELAENEVHLNGVISKVGEISWEEDLVAPVGGGEDVYEDVTDRYLTNPSFENTQVTEAAHSHSGPNGGVWIPAGWTGDNSFIDTDGFTQGLVSSGKQGDGKSETGFSPAEGSHFYFFRCRWRADTFTLNQVMKDLPAGRYDLTFAAAVDSKVPGSLRLSGAVDKTLALAESALTVYSVPFNVINPGDVSVTVSVSRVNQDAPALLVLDNFQLIYRGGADEQQAIEELQNALDALREQLSLFDQGSLPSGVIADWNTAEEIGGKADSDPTFDNLTEAVFVYRKVVNEAQECGDLYNELYTAFANVDIEITETPLPGEAAYREAEQSALNMLVGEDALYYASDLKAELEKLAQARRTYYLSASQNATETIPVELTEAVVISSDFTKTGGDPSLAADAISTGWQTHNVSSGGDFRLNTISGKNCWNNWSNNFTSMDAYQEIPNLPEGMYQISCVTTTNDIPHDQHAYVASVAGTAVSPVATLYATGDFASTAEWEKLTTDRVYLPEGGTLRIGMASTSGGGTSGWFCMTDFRLFYYKSTVDAAKEALNLKIQDGEALLDSAHVKIMGVEKAILNAAITNAKKANTSGQISISYVEMNVAMDTAMVSVKAYNAMYPTLEEAKTVVNESGYSAEAKAALNNVIAEQEAILVDVSTSAADLPLITPVLRKAINIFLNSKIVIPDDVSADKPYDLTGQLLKNPSIDPQLTVSNDVIPEGWIINKGSGNTYSNTGQYYTGDVTNRYLDSWNGTVGNLKYTAKQVISGIPNGTYRLVCVGRSSGEGSYAYAIGSGLYIQEMDAYYDKGGSIWEAAAEGSDVKLAHEGQGWGWQTLTVDNINVDNNELTVGVTTDVAISQGKAWNGNWFSADDFRLYCIGKNFSTDIGDVGMGENEKLNVYVENGYVKVEGVDHFTITTVSGAQLDSGAQLVPGFYIVTAKGQSVKIAVK